VVRWVTSSAGRAFGLGDVRLSTALVGPGGREPSTSTHGAWPARWRGYAVSVGGYAVSVAGRCCATL